MKAVVFNAMFENYKLTFIAIQLIAPESLARRQVLGALGVDGKVLLSVKLDDRPWLTEHEPAMWAADTFISGPSVQLFKQCMVGLHEKLQTDFDTIHDGDTVELCSYASCSVMM